MTKKEIALDIIDDEIKKIRMMQPDEDENEISFEVRKMHYLAEAKAIKLRIFNELSKQLVEEAYNMAISALEKQIPKKPDVEGDSYDKDGNMIYDTWICPCCGICYEVEYDEYDYCPECGQKLDMSDASN